MYDNALLLEGGAMRGLYTAGVLDAFMEAGLEFGCVYGVSAGVLNAVNYVARQPGRSANVNYTCINDRRYLSMTNLLHGQSIFNFDYLFNQVPLSIPFDYDAFAASPQRLIAVATNCLTGEPVLFEKGRCAQFFRRVRRIVLYAIGIARKVGRRYTLSGWRRERASAP